MKKIFSIALVVALIISALPAVFASDESVTTAAAEWEYTTSSGSVTITKYNGTSEIVEIPSEINGNPVTTIGASSSTQSIFADPDNVKEVIFPETVTTINQYAFRNSTNLEKVTLNEGLTIINRYAFASCSSLVSLDLPSTLTTIERFAFSRTAIETIKIPASVTSIGNAIFIGGKVSSIEVDAENTAYYSVDGVLFKDNILMQYPPCKPDEEYTLPENITGINSQAMTHTQYLKVLNLSAAFSGSLLDKILANAAVLEAVNAPEEHPGLTSIDGVLYNKKRTTLYYYPIAKPDKVYNIPETVTNTNSSQTDSYYLEEIVIPAGGSFVPYGEMPSLTKYTVAEDNENYLTIDGVVFSKSGDTLVTYPAGKTDEVYAVPEDVNTIAPYAFYYSANLKRVDFPDSVTTIKYSAFWYSGIETMVLPPIELIDSGVFMDCKNLKSLTIPVTVTRIGRGSFSDCTAASIDVYYMGREEQWNQISGYSELDNYIATLNFNPDATPLPTPTATPEPGETVNDGEWTYFAGVESGIKILAYNGYDVDLVIPDSFGDAPVTSIGDEAFKAADFIESVTIPKGVTAIGKNAFAACTALNTVNYGGTLAEWSMITVAEGNEPLLSANLKCAGEEATEWGIGEVGNGKITVTAPNDVEAGQNITVVIVSYDEIGELLESCLPLSFTTEAGKTAYELAADAPVQGKIYLWTENLVPLITPFDLQYGF